MTRPGDKGERSWRQFPFFALRRTFVQAANTAERSQQIERLTVVETSQFQERF